MSEYLIRKEFSVESFKKKRKELGLTQKQLAEVIGVSKPTVERWESQDKPITGPVVLLMEMLTRNYLEQRLIPENHFPLRLWYMYRDEVCTLIDVDERRQLVTIKNYKANPQFLAFGKNESPIFSDYREFLESRCFPESRDKLNTILADLNLPFYDPFLIIKKTQGRMAEDDFWIKVDV